MTHSKNILWLGAHKTGTTYLQNILAQSRPALARLQRLYIDMPACRSLYTRPLLDPPGGKVADPPAPLPRLEPPSGRYLLFDENILSLVQNAVAPFGLYPDGAERALRFASTLQLEAPDLVLGIRGFAEYLPSLYCETLKSMPFQPFEHFQKARFTALSWCDLAERLLAAFPGARLWVYRAEDLRGRETALLNWICRGAANTPWVRQPQSSTRARREGFSQAAITALHARDQARRSEGRSGASPEDLAECLRLHPRSAESPGFSPWSAAQKQTLETLYAQDVSALRGLPRVSIWVPVASTF